MSAARTPMNRWCAKCTRQAGTSSANGLGTQKDNTDSNLNWCSTTQTRVACVKDYWLSQTTKANPAVRCPPKPHSQTTLTHWMLASKKTIKSHPGRLAAPDDQVFSLFKADLRKTLKKVNTHKVGGPDGIPSCVLRRADQLGRCLFGHLQPVPGCSPHLI